MNIEKFQGQGANRANYQWYKFVNNVWIEIPGAVNASLTFANANEGVKGQYRCRINCISIEGNRAISAYSDSVETLYSKRSVIFDGIKASASGANTTEIDGADLSRFQLTKSPGANSIYAGMVGAFTMRVFLDADATDTAGTEDTADIYVSAPFRVDKRLLTLQISNRSGYLNALPNPSISLVGGDVNDQRLLDAEITNNSAYITYYYILIPQVRRIPASWLPRHRGSISSAQGSAPLSMARLISKSSTANTPSMGQAESSP
ncbi:MAG: hypothetical protein FWH55_10905 [Oscillospiraceae bacterium]|nr:hypothetical protein [Oscillospiraceae bacterium]